MHIFLVLTKYTVGEGWGCLEFPPQAIESYPQSQNVLPSYCIVITNP